MKTRSIHSLAAVIGVAGLILFANMNAPKLKFERIRKDVRRDFPEVRQIQTEALHEWLGDSEKEPPVLWDARSLEEYNVSHLPGARHVPPRVPIHRLIPELDPERPVVVYCALGYRASETVELLRQAGFHKARNLDGAIFKWANEGRPLRDARERPARQVHPYNAANGTMLRAECRAALPGKPGFLNGDAPTLRNLKASSAMVLLVCLLCWETLLPAIRFFSGHGDTRIRHGIRNYALGALNTICVMACFVPIWWQAANLVETRQLGLLGMIPNGGLRLFLAILLLDLWTWTWHKLNHDIPFFWRFHRVHHSDLHLDVTSAARFHLGELILSSLIRIPLIFLLGVRFGELIAYEALLFAAVQFHHANIRISPAWDKALSCFIVTPGVHRVHHSRNHKETDSNFSSMLTVWDRLLGTWVERERPEEIKIGLKEFDHAKDQSLTGLMITPFNNSNRKG